MNRPPIFTSVLLATATAIGGCASLVNQSILKPVAVPEILRTAPNEKLVMIVPATGVQTYECRINASGTLMWDFIAPTADLFDQTGQRIGKHYAGPTWELSDGSKIVGTLKQRADAPVSGAIPWLLIGTKSTGGPGKFAAISSLQRVNTVGGVAPSGGCDRSNVGKRADVSYTADYYYFATM
jgi:Protein of unknown function (DUF3455)